MIVYVQNDKKKIYTKNGRDWVYCIIMMIIISSPWKSHCCVRVYMCVCVCV